MNPRVLIVDDEYLFAKAVGKKLTRGGYECSFASNLAEAERSLNSQRPDLLLLDMRLPDGSGLDFLRHHAGSVPTTIVMTAYAEIEDAVTAMKYGALDYLTKPVDLERLQSVLDSSRKRAVASEPARPVGRAPDEEPGLLGESPVMQDLRGRLARVAELVGRAHGAPPVVLLAGETGAGKDLVARWLHAHSPRRDQPFIQVDCAALPRELIEAELFGHERGAYTGAHGERQGLIEVAGAGTVLLDEIGELPLELQAKLLAVLERRSLRRIGGTRERPVSAWFIAASNRDLASMVRGGGFRADLYYRLRVVSITLPPLRERGDDVVLLARHFSRQAARRYALPEPEFTPRALETLRRQRWPGNVRELRNLIERAVLLGSERTLDVDALLIEEPTDSLPDPPGDLDLERTEIELIQRALEEASGNVSAAARRLGITRMTLRYRMQKYGISVTP